MKSRQWNLQGELRVRGGEKGWRRPSAPSVEGRVKQILTEGGDVERGVAFLGGCIDSGSTCQELRNDIHVTFLRRQMQRVQSVLSTTTSTTLTATSISMAGQHYEFRRPGWQHQSTGTIKLSIGGVAKSRRKSSQMTLTAGGGRHRRNPIGAESFGIDSINGSISRN